VTEAKLAAQQVLHAADEGDVDALVAAAKNISLVASGRAAAADAKTKREKGSPADVVSIGSISYDRTDADWLRDSDFPQWMFGLSDQR